MGLLSLLIFNVVNIDRYNPRKEKFFGVFRQLFALLFEIVTRLGIINCILNLSQSFKSQYCTTWYKLHKPCSNFHFSFFCLCVTVFYIFVCVSIMQKIYNLKNVSFYMYTHLPFLVIFIPFYKSNLSSGLIFHQPRELLLAILVVQVQWRYILVF